MQSETTIKRKVLVVDDELINRRLLGFIVSRDYDVLYAENGVQALEVIKKNIGTLSLVLLDLLMPEMDGYELLQTLNHDEELRRIPVIILTSEKSAEVQALQLGAVDFIPKPYDMPEVILARVQRSIQLAEDNILILENERDALTNLYSKGFFLQYARQHDRYYPDMQMDALTFNINRFHLVNELRGRVYGDDILKIIAELLQAYTVKAGGLACRCDSDLFCLYTSHIEDCDIFLAEFVKAFEERTDHAKITIRIGICQNSENSVNLEQRFDHANAACAKLRHSYHTEYAIYDNQLHEKELYQEKLISEMDNALAERQFKVYYQPKYNIQGEKPVLASAEALIRWIHPETGMISPGVFISLFESNGLIKKLDHFVWKEAAAQIQRWKEQFGRTIPISVNVSRIDVYDPNLENELEQILVEHSLQPEELLLEITESAYTENSSQIVEKVKNLRSKGFRIEMDDFGSGYSSLNMLTSLPIDALKLDMKFIRNITQNPKNFRMVELMLDIAKFLNVPVVAEGVETQEQYQLLKDAGCDIIQGYYFSKPVPPEEFAHLIRKEQNHDN